MKVQAALGNGRVLVCGSRKWTDFGLLARELDLVHPGAICHGNAFGADQLAGLWAERHDVTCVAYPARWNEHGRAAGHRRNAFMLEAFGPDLVLAFKDGFDYGMRRGGTEHMVGIAQRAGVTTRVITHAHTRVLAPRSLR